MNLEPPQPPTAPAPAIRPTPPTPPRIDRTPFVKENPNDGAQKSTDVYEEMAKDAVAHGSGPLTKRAVDRSTDENPIPAPQQGYPSTQDEDTQSDYDRGQDVLREFQAIDAGESRSSYDYSAQTSKESESYPVPRINHNEGHGGVFWIFTIIFVAIASFIIAKKFLFTDKPQLTKSQLFEDDKLKTTTDKVESVKSSPKLIDKPARHSNKKEDSKGKHFEIRI